jgi:hypothetical protein
VLAEECQTLLRVWFGERREVEPLR